MALTRPTTSPGKASSIVSRSWPNTEWAYLVANGLPVRPWVTTMPRSKRPEHTRRKAMRSRCDGSMLACTLNTNPENGASSGRGVAVDVGRGRRAAAPGRPRRRAACRTPKLVSAEPKNTGVGLAGQERLRRRGRRRPRRAARARPGPSAQASPSSAAAALGVDDLLGRLGGAAGRRG